MTASPDQLVMHGQTSYELVIDGVASEQPVDFFYTRTALEAERSVVQLPGLREGRSSIKALVADLGHLPLVGMELVFPYTKDETAIEGTIAAAPLAVSQAINELKGTSTANNLAGQSLGGGVALKSFSMQPEALAGLAMITPFGVTNRLFSPGKLRLRQIVDRLQQNSSTIQAEDTDNDVPLPSDPLLNTRDMLKLSGYGLAQDGIPLLESLDAAGHPMVVTVGEDDPVFPVNEVERALGSHLMHLVQRVPGRHYSFGAPGGRRQIDLSIQRLMALQAGEAAAA